MLQPDQDVIRGLGFVTLHSAYLEEEIENLRSALGSIEAVGEREHKWPISKKIERVREIVENFDFEGRGELLANLDEAKATFESRNEVVHGRIYAGFDRGQTLRAGRPNIPDRPIEPGELYDLANHFMALRNEILRPMLFKIPRALAARPRRLVSSV